MGLLIAVVGGVLLVAAARHTVTFEIGLLGAAGALGLAAVDVIYTLDGTIRPIYLLDALPELLLVAGWLAVGLLARG